MPILESKADKSGIRRVLRAISDALFRRGVVSANPLGVDRPGACSSTKTEPCHTKTTRHRLADAVARLERLEAERERRGDSRFGKITENRIVWGELIQLELQEIDEQVSRICSAAGRSPLAPMKSNLREGRPHERDDS
jgi:hypothetical protein